MKNRKGSKARKKNPQDLTLRNLRALRKDFRKICFRMSFLEDEFTDLEIRIEKLEGVWKSPEERFSKLKKRTEKLEQHNKKGK